MSLDWLWGIVGLLGGFTRAAPASAPAAPDKVEPSLRITEAMLERLRVKQEQDRAQRQRLFSPAPPPPLAFGKSPGAERLAADSALALAPISAYALNSGIEFGPGSGIAWLGYPYLAELSQRPENRIIVELFADEMTRKWVRLKSTGDEDKSDKIKKLDAAIRRYRLRDHFRNVKRDDGYFGMGQLYIKLKGVADSPALLASPLIVDPRTIPKGSLIGFQKVEPYWIYPQSYNSSDPLRDDFFRPVSWTIMGSTVHATRMLTFIGNPVPDLLKASYSFGGISVTQLMKPYVDAFLRTKGSVNDLISSFSTMVFRTNMSAFLNANAKLTLQERIEAFNLYRDNFGTFVLDHATEEMDNVSTPLGGLSELQAQAEEHMLIPARVPLLKAFGLSPSGLNVSNDNEIRSWYDNVLADQESEYRDPLEKALKIIQLSEFGEIDEEIEIDFVPLWQLDEAGEAAVEKERMDTIVEAINSGMVSPEEGRQALADDPDSMFHGLEGPPPDPPEMMDENGNIISEPVGGSALRGGVSGSTRGANNGV